MQKKKDNKVLLNGAGRSHQQAQDPADEAHEDLSAQPPLGCWGECGLLGYGLFQGFPKRRSEVLLPAAVHSDVALINCRLPQACQDFQRREGENLCGIPHTTVVRGEPVCSPAYMPKITKYLLM